MRAAQEAVEAAEDRLWQLREGLLGWVYDDVSETSAHGEDSAADAVATAIAEVVATQ